VKTRLELWIVAAWALLAAEVGYLIALGNAGPGAGPVRLYVYAPLALMGAALAVGALGLAWSFFHPPLRQGRRLAALSCCAFVFLSAAYPIPFPAHRAENPSRVAFRLPVAGEWITAWGGDDTARNLLARTTPALRYALVLVADDAEGSEVVAPAPGRVAGVGVAPQLGQYVVLEVAQGEYLFLGSLLEGSVPVGAGAEVEAGTPLGRVGATAVTNLVTGPHLSLHLQDTPEPVWGQGVPWFLHGVEIDGRAVEKGMPEGVGLEDGRWTGQRVRAAPESE
jgi:murein DD-endopeptidase MepM/ murein hydrolase activator NlpD